MHRRLTGTARKDFFLRVLALLREFEATAAVVVVDANYHPANKGAKSPEEDATRLLLERIGRHGRRWRAWTFVVADRPGGGREDETAFLTKCLELVQTGTPYVKLEWIAHNVLTTSSRHSRLLQAADFITGCTLATIAGDQHYAPPLFEQILSLLDRGSGRVGGVGLKLHPDARYLNLYHWLLRDDFLSKGGQEYPLPSSRHQYSKDPFVP